MRLSTVLIMLMIGACNACCNDFTGIGEYQVATKVDAIDGGAADTLIDGDEAGNVDNGVDGASDAKEECSMPSGTVAIVSGSAADHPPALVLDGKLETTWNAGNRTGWIYLGFPAPRRITSVRIAASANPESNQTFTLTGYPSGGGTLIETKTFRVDTSFVTWLPAIAAADAVYNGLRIDVVSDNSWIDLGEVEVCN